MHLGHFLKFWHAAGCSSSARACHVCMCATSCSSVAHARARSCARGPWAAARVVAVEPLLEELVGYSYGGSAKRHVELSRSVKLRMRVHDLAWASPTRQPRRGGIGRRYVSQGTHEHIWHPHTRSYPAHTRPYRSRICARAHAHWAKTPVQLEKTYLAK